MKMRKCLVLLCAGFLASAAMAKPASPFPVTQKQKRRRFAELLNRGDEYYSKGIRRRYLLVAGRLAIFLCGAMMAGHRPSRRTMHRRRSSRERSFLNGRNEDSAKANYYRIA